MVEHLEITRRRRDAADLGNVYVHEQSTVPPDLDGRADIVVLDPQALRRADLGQYAEAAFDELGGLRRVVNRNDGIIKATLINGQVAWADDAPSPDLGKARHFGRFLRRRAQA